MCSRKEGVTESSNSTCGSTPQQTSTHTPFCGIRSRSCKQSNPLNYHHQITIFIHESFSHLNGFVFYFSFSVDGTPIRQFKNAEASGVPFPKNQPMRIYSSLWNADDWATRGGLVKTDWSQAPFTASYRNFNAEACIWSSGASSCTMQSPSPSPSPSNNDWHSQVLDSSGQERLNWVKTNYMIYNYCNDLKRFPQGPPPECST